MALTLREQTDKIVDEIRESKEDVTTVVITHMTKLQDKIDAMQETITSQVTQLEYQERWNNFVNMTEHQRHTFEELREKLPQENSPTSKNREYEHLLERLNEQNIKRYKGEPQSFALYLNAIERVYQRQQPAAGGQPLMHTPEDEALLRVIFRLAECNPEALDALDVVFVSQGDVVGEVYADMPMPMGELYRNALTPLFARSNGECCDRLWIQLQVLGLVMYAVLWWIYGNTIRTDAGSHTDFDPYFWWFFPSMNLLFFLSCVGIKCAESEFRGTIATRPTRETVVSIVATAGLVVILQGQYDARSEKFVALLLYNLLLLANFLCLKHIKFSIKAKAEALHSRSVKAPIKLYIYLSAVGGSLFTLDRSDAWSWLSLIYRPCWLMILLWATNGKTQRPEDDIDTPGLNIPTPLLKHGQAPANDLQRADGDQDVLRQQGQSYWARVDKTCWLACFFILATYVLWICSTTIDHGPEHVSLLPSQLLIGLRVASTVLLTCFNLFFLAQLLDMDHSSPASLLPAIWPCVFLVGVINVSTSDIEMSSDFSQGWFWCWGTLFLVWLARKSCSSSCPWNEGSWFRERANDLVRFPFLLLLVVRAVMALVWILVYSDEPSASRLQRRYRNASLDAAMYLTEILNFWLFTKLSRDALVRRDGRQRQLDYEFVVENDPYRHGYFRSLWGVLVLCGLFANTIQSGVNDGSEGYAMLICDSLAAFLFFTRSVGRPNFHEVDGCVRPICDRVF